MPPPHCPLSRSLNALTKRRKLRERMSFSCMAHGQGARFWKKLAAFA